MRSHVYQFSARAFAGVVLPTLVLLAAAGGSLRLGADLGLLPALSARRDPDRMVLAHQAEAARSHRRAEVILLGDSTCLMGVDAAALQRELPGHPPVLSLALFIWLGVDNYGEALADYAAANPGTVRAVVLLVTATKLRSDLENQTAIEQWREVRSGTGRARLENGDERLADWTGARLLRERLLSRVLDTPLRGSGAARFGFLSQIDQYMTEHEGNLVEYGTLERRAHSTGPGPGRQELSPGLEAKTRRFRAQVPAGVKLFVGLTPGAELPGGTGKPEDETRLLRRWNEWLHADALLTNLPPVLPEVCFSPSGHLNEEGQGRFTKALARQLGPLLK